MNKGIIFGLMAASLGLAASASAGASFYVGGGMLPLKIEGVKDIAVSDWQIYGLGGAEGRMRLPLSKAETSGLVPTVNVGVQADFHPLLTGLLEAHFGFASSNTTLTMISVGGLFTPVNTGRFTLGLGPKVGYAIGTVNFGETSVIPGKLAPVILSEGTIQNGTKIEAGITGVTVQGVISAKYMFTPQIGLQLDGGYLYGVMGDFKLKAKASAGDIELKKDNKALVLDNGSSTQAGIDPKASMSGAIGTVALVYAFN
jgi:hypothetical protein